ncbi:MAG: site-2 protease family protein [Planctomycetes bacterium]|nr:site-2 protease family protein [Planctomycetota bacterium]
MFWILALLGFGFVIAIHEFGHFTFAKLAGVKVERFSIGFGPILWSRRVGETEYSLSLLPLGGYVKMLGEDNPAQGATVGDVSDPRSYLAASRGWKALILLGGVTFNLVSSWLILVGLAFWGMPMTPPVIAGISPTVEADGEMKPSPAKLLGLRQGDEVREVNGQRTRSWDEIAMRVAIDNRQPITMRVRREVDGKVSEIALPETAGAEVYASNSPIYRLPTIGIERPQGPSLGRVARLDGELRPNDPRPDDRILAIDGVAVPDGALGHDIERRLRAFLGRVVTLKLARGDGSRDEVAIRYAGSPRDNLAIEVPAMVTGVMDDSPAQRAGVLAGDILLAVDGESVRSPGNFIGQVNRRDGAELVLRVRRGAEEPEFRLSAADAQGQRIIGVRVAEFFAGKLPFLPPALDGSPGALAAAGMQPGDALLLRIPGGKDEKPRYLALAGGDEVLVPLTLHDLEALDDRNIFKRPLASRLFGVQITSAVADDRVAVIDALKNQDQIELGALSDETRGGLRAALAPGDWIAGARSHGEGNALVIIRGATAAPRALDLKPVSDAVALEFTPFYEPPYRLEHWSEAFAIANGSARRMVTDTLRLIPKFFASRADGGIAATQTLSGPIGIFTMFKTSAEKVGFASFLKLVALIGLNLFLVNLLPIPIVDGGQLLFLGIEAVIRRPLPETMRAVANYAGFALVVALMLFTIGIDVWRLIN